MTSPFLSPQWSSLFFLAEIVRGYWTTVECFVCSVYEHNVFALSRENSCSPAGGMVPAAFISQDTSCTWSQQKNKVHQARQAAGVGCAASQGWTVVAGLMGQLEPKLPSLTCVHPPCCLGTPQDLLGLIEEQHVNLQSQTPTHGWLYLNKVFEFLLKSTEVLGSRAYGLDFV